MELETIDLHEFEQAFAKWQKRNGTHTDEETTLLARINENAQLYERTNLTESEHMEYVSLLRHLEARNVERLEALLALARKRGTTLRGLMKTLGLPDIKDAA